MNGIQEVMGSSPTVSTTGQRAKVIKVLMNNRFVSTFVLLLALPQSKEYIDYKLMFIQVSLERFYHLRPHASIDCTGIIAFGL